MIKLRFNESFDHLHHLSFMRVGEVISYPHYTLSFFSLGLTGSCSVTLRPIAKIKKTFCAEITAASSHLSAKIFIGV